jgi:hypothetical protein
MFLFLPKQKNKIRYMDGFRWALKGGQPCINLYFASWQLNVAYKMILAMIGILLLAVGTEAISKYRHTLSTRAKTTPAHSRAAQTLRTTQMGLHGLQALTGYILMLATMTFALELLCSVILGLVIGYAVFGGDQYSHVTTNPCCAFLEEEASERSPNNTTRTTMPRATAARTTGAAATTTTAAAAARDDAREGDPLASPTAESEVKNGGSNRSITLDNRDQSDHC